MTPRGGGSAVTSREDRALAGHLAAAAHGERSSIEFVLRRIRPLVTRYCRARLGRSGPRYTRADAVAERACLAVLAQLPSHLDRTEPFLAMVYAVTEGKVGEAREAPARARPASRGDRPVDRNTSAPREHHLCPSALAEQMGRLVASLPEGQRELLILRAINGLSAEETADVIGSTPAAVRVAQHRALTWLRVATMHRPGV